MRSRLMTATQREADARMEAQMLAVDATDMQEQLQQVTASLMAEQQRSAGLERHLAVRCSSQQHTTPLLSFRPLP